MTSIENREPLDSGGSSKDECRCGCLRGSHMGKPRGCMLHGFHEYEPEAPPLTPEEEEEVAECSASSSGACLRETLGETACDTDAGECVHGGRPESEAPPAPSRRPPVAVAYGVEGGALYEVLVPGDATVAAVDGALRITHDRGVVGIVQIRPYGPAKEVEVAGVGKTEDH